MDEAASMYPTLSPGAQVFVMSTSTHGNITIYPPVSIGDILVFKVKNVLLANGTYFTGMVAHRVIEISNKGNMSEYLTKGDNMKSGELWVNQSQVYGKVVGVLY